MNKIIIMFGKLEDINNYLKITTGQNYQEKKEKF